MSLVTCGIARVLLMLVSLVIVGSPVQQSMSWAQTGPVHETVPASIDPSRKYLFYMHNLLVEREGPNAVHPKYGRYYYHEILKALADGGLVVISELRPANADRVEYAQKVARQVRTLLAAGVAPENITATGFSKGGSMVLIASAELGDPNVSFVVMAGCGAAGPPQKVFKEEILPKFAPRLQGRLLSIYDEADSETRSCQEAFNRASGLVHKEIKLDTGLGHGVFFAPRKEWLDLVVDWAHRR